MSKKIIPKEMITVSVDRIDLFFTRLKQDIVVKTIGFKNKNI